METVFRKGDKVFDILFGWGKVVAIKDLTRTYPIVVDFCDGNANAEYTKEGRYYEHSNKSLSFTEYTLEGFSQERPKELNVVNVGEFKKGEIYYFWDSEHPTHVSCAKFAEYRPETTHPFITDMGWRFKYCSIENPLLK